ncbi:hypothetical protein [Limosilactobacillus fastidiosus]|uniref:CshA domain-containing protein n=1 Tax=Limosilactobacillus fastidiosus TaxID=2759855 RepID=A0ABR6E9Z7_9LACO|nr:hypothetical protein [Limosilactobacillus fastidiosus]MBB1063812.1 hypothetical protein [Limosilactobacillus fastidiosus]MCD7084387.1 hypothetical protein [Limosilactobacillus fastidiosus]
MTDYDQQKNTNLNNVADWSASPKINGNTALADKTDTKANHNAGKINNSLIINSVSGDMKHPIQTVTFSPNPDGSYNSISLKAPQGVLLDQKGNQITSFDPTVMMNEGRNEELYLADTYIGGYQQSFGLLGTQSQEKTIDIHNDQGVKTSFALSPSPYLNEPQRTQFISFKRDNVQQAIATLPALKADKNGQLIANAIIGTYQLTFTAIDNLFKLKVTFYSNDPQYQGKIAPVYIISNDEFARVSFFQYQPNIFLPQYHLQRKIVLSNTTITPFLYTNLSIEQYQNMVKNLLYSNSSYIPQIETRRLILPDSQPILELPVTKLSFIVNGQENPAKVLKQKLLGGGVNTFTLTQGNKIHFEAADGFSGQTSPIRLLVKTANGDSHEVDFSVNVVKYDIKNISYSDGQQGHSKVEAIGEDELPSMKISEVQPAVFVKDNKTTTVIEITANGERIGEAEIETDTGMITYYPERSFKGTVDPQTVCVFMQNGRKVSVKYQPTIR